MEIPGRRDFVFALLLALIAGCVDAVGFLQLGGFFVSFMSGNTTRLGVGLGSMSWREAGLAAGLIATFVGGAALGAIAGRSLGDKRRTGLLLLEAALLGMAAISHVYGQIGAATVPMVLAMGVANAFFENDGDMRFGIAHITGALVKVGQGIAALADGGPSAIWKPYAALWASMAAGAIFGAAAWLAIGGRALFCPSALLLIMAFASARKQAGRP